MRFQLVHILCLLGTAEALAIGDYEKRHSSGEEYVVALPTMYIGYCNSLTRKL
jgi:hypothetical protein